MSSQTKIVIRDSSTTAENIFKIQPYCNDKWKVCQRLEQYIGGMAEGQNAQSMYVNIDGGPGAVQAHGTLTLSGVVAGNTAQVGDQVFVASASPVGPNQFLVGGSNSATATNLAAAINANPNLSAVVTAVASGAVVTVTSTDWGNKGNMIQLVGSGSSSQLGIAASYAVLGASAVSNTGSSALSGNLGIYPNNSSSITGFPPGSYTGTENAGNAAAAAAQAAAQATYTQMQATTATTIATALDSQTLTPGVYKAASGTFTLAQSGNGTVTLNGAGTYVFQTATTLTTGAGGIPTMTLENGALASNVYFVVGSSATINSGSAGTFQGNIIAQASITDTLGGTVNGSLIALTGAVTLSAAAAVNANPSVVDITANAPYLTGGVEPASVVYVFGGIV
jgi:hypothetical protein